MSRLVLAAVLAQHGRTSVERLRSLLQILPGAVFVVMTMEMKIKSHEKMVWIGLIKKSLLQIICGSSWRDGKLSRV